MSMEKTEGLIIRLADFGETSRVVTFFTRDFGKVPMVAKGGRRLKSPFEAALDLLTACRIVFLRKSTGGLDVLTEAHLLRRFRPEGGDLSRFYAGCYVAELLSGLTEDHDPHPELYEQAVDTLEALSGPIDPCLATVRFELKLLREIGQLPTLTECVVCGRPVGQQGVFAYWVSQGGLICPTCRTQSYTSQRIHGGSLAVLRRLLDADAQVLHRLVVTPQQFAEIRRMVTAAVSHCLGRRPRLLRYIQRSRR